MESARLQADDQVVEQQLDLATRQWLTEASTTARRALRVLGRNLDKQHDDLWLSEMLALPHSAEGVAAQRELAQAIEENSHNEADAALASATAARVKFEILKSGSGSTRAAIEQAYALHRLLKPEACLDLVRPIVPALERHHYTWSLVQALLEASACHALAGQLGDALRLDERAQNIAHSCKYPSLELRAIGFRASHHYATGNTRKAWEENVAGLHAYWSSGLPRLRAYQFYAAMAESAESSQLWPLALAANREAVHVIETSGKPSVEAVARSALAMIASLAGDSTEAVAEYGAAKRLFQSLPEGDLKRRYLLDIGVSLAELESSAGMVQGRYVTDLLAAHPPLPLETFPLLALRYYRTLGNIQYAQQKHELALPALRIAAFLASQTSKTLPYGPDRAAWNRESDSVYHTVLQLEAEAKRDPLRLLRIWLAWRNPPDSPAGPSPVFNYSALERLPPPLPEQDLDGLRSILRGVTAITYLQFEHGLYIFAFDDRGIEWHYVQISRLELATIINRFRMLCADPGSGDRWKVDARRLYSLLIEPLAGKLEDRRILLFLHDRTTAGIPVSALLGPGDIPFGESFAIASVPAMTPPQVLSTPSMWNPHVLAVTAVPLGMPAPPGSTQEISSVMSRFPDTTVLRGREATRAGMNRELPNAELFHFVGHAVTSAETGSLLLSSADLASREPEAFGSQEIAQLTLRGCRLVVLAACDTASGEMNLWNPDSLVRAFFDAGVGAVIAARWPVESASAARLFSAFYSALDKPESAGRALQHAAGQLRSSPLTAHPYYWADFELYTHLSAESTRPLEGKSRQYAF